MRVGDARPPPFTIVNITYKVAVYAPAERADTVPLFHLYPYVLCGVAYSMARVLDESYSQLTPLVGVAVPARQSTVHRLEPCPSYVAWRAGMATPE
jgi:hypothetical protein